MSLGSTGQGTTVHAGAKLALGGGLVITEPLTLFGYSGSTVLGYGSNTLSGSISLLGQVTFNVGESLFLSGAVGGTGGLTKVSSGTLELSGTAPNSYTGPTRVNRGILNLNKSNVPALAGPLYIGTGDTTYIERVIHLAGNQIRGAAVTVNQDGRLELNNFSDSVGPLTLSAGTVVTTGTGMLTLNGNVTSLAHSATATISGKLNLGTDTRTFTVADGTAATDLIVSAEVQGSGGLTKSGTGTLQLSGTAPNTHTGVTTVNAGTLLLSKSAGVDAIFADLVIGDGTGTDTVRLTADHQIKNTAPVRINSSGVLDLTSAADRSDMIGTLTMSGGLVTTGQGVLTLNGNVTTIASGTSARILGNLDLGALDRVFAVADGLAEDDLLIEALVRGGAGIDLTKNGAGTMRMTADADTMRLTVANVYSGLTTVDAGTLLIDSGLSAGAMLVNSGGTLGGRGTVGTVNSNGGTILGSGATGALLVNNLTLNSTSKVNVVLGGPILVVKDAVNLNNATLELSAAFPVTSGQKFVILQNQNSDPITGTFAGLAQDAIFTVAGVTYQIKYNGGDGNDVELTVL